MSKITATIDKVLGHADSPAERVYSSTPAQVREEIAAAARGVRFHNRTKVGAQEKPLHLPLRAYPVLAVLVPLKVAGAVIRGVVSAIGHAGSAAASVASRFVPSLPHRVTR